jgi:hypothetical protein
MTRSFRALLVLGFAAVAIAGLARPAAAASDGLWSVLIITEKGTCDRGYRYPVKIARGVIGHADTNSSFDIRGRVSGGRINVSVSRGSQSARGSGRIGATTGTGTWRTISGECSGTWTAEKRG